MSKAVVTTQNNQPVSVKNLLSQDAYKKRFEEILGGKKSRAFMASLLNVVGQDNKLQECEPKSVIIAAAIAATLDLPVDPNLGMAYIIPYKDKKYSARSQSPIHKATLQLGYKAFVQLAMRSGQYKTINAAEIYEGELKYFNRITGDFEFDPEGKSSETIVGYGAYFRLLNGFEKFIFMTVDELWAHAKEYSQSYRYAENNRKDSRWHKNPKDMMTKTVLKRILSKYGVLSIDMQTALINDDKSDNIESEGIPARVDQIEKTERLNLEYKIEDPEIVEASKPDGPVPI